MTRRQSGFTLIEVLVVMSLLSLIMVAMGSALRTLSMTEVRVDDRLQRNDQMRVAFSFMASTLGRIEEVKVVVPGNNSAKQVQFAADGKSIRWVGIMPARHGTGGQHFFRLAVEDSTQGSALVLRFAPWRDQADFPVWEQSESYTLATGISEFLVETQGLPLDIQAISATWPRQWQEGWPVKDAVPQHVRLTMADQKGPWPPLVIALVPTHQSQPGGGGFVLGGTSR
jgi:general secretion pathway protein J